MVKHNLDNPKCPDCSGITHKSGWQITRDGKFQRFQCNNCARAFTENTQNVRIEDILEYIKGRY